MFAQPASVPSIPEFHQRNVETIRQGKIDGTYDLGARGFLKIGAKYRDTRRSFDQDQPTWVRGGNAATRFTLGQYRLGGPQICVQPNSADTDQCYTNGRTFDIAALKAFTDQNRGGAPRITCVSAALILSCA